MGQLLCAQQQFKTQQELEAAIKRLESVDLKEQKNVDCIYSDIVGLLRLGKEQKTLDKDSVDSNIAYIQRADVQRQATHWIQVNHLQTTRVFIKMMKWDNAPPTAFMEWLAVDTEGKQWKLNFWPCSDCACVACVAVEK